MNLALRFFHYFLNFYSIGTPPLLSVFILYSAEWVLPDMETADKSILSKLLFAVYERFLQNLECIHLLYSEWFINRAKGCVTNANSPFHYDDARQQWVL